MSLVKFICNKRIINSMVSIFIICCLYSSFAQTGHSYPRVGVFTWGGAPAEWYAEFDLIFSWSKDADLVKEIKAINPSTLVVNTADWNTGAYIRDGLPDEFVLKNSLKDVIGFYVGSINIKPEQQTPNFSSVCPTVNGKQCNEFFARYVTDRVDLNIFDGV